MDWQYYLIHYGILAWMGGAFLCLGLGTLFTVKRHKQKQHSHHGEPPNHMSYTRAFCSACGKQTDDPSACWCGFCGQSLQGKICRRGEEEVPKKRLVDIRTIDREIQRQKQAIHHEYKANIRVGKSTKSH